MPDVPPADRAEENSGKFPPEKVWNGPRTLATIIIGLTLMTVLATLLTLMIGKFFAKRIEERALANERKVQLERARRERVSPQR